MDERVTLMARVIRQHTWDRNTRGCRCGTHSGAFHDVHVAQCVLDVLNEAVA